MIFSSTQRSLPLFWSLLFLDFTGSSCISRSSLRIFFSSNWRWVINLFRLYLVFLIILLVWHIRLLGQLWIGILRLFGLLLLSQVQAIASFTARNLLISFYFIWDIRLFVELSYFWIRFWWIELLLQRINYRWRLYGRRNILLLPIKTIVYRIPIVHRELSLILWIPKLINSFDFRRFWHIF